MSQWHDNIGNCIVNFRGLFLPIYKCYNYYTSSGYNYIHDGNYYTSSGYNYIHVGNYNASSCYNYTSPGYNYTYTTRYQHKYIHGDVCRLYDNRGLDSKCNR